MQHICLLLRNFWTSCQKNDKQNQTKHIPTDVLVFGCHDLGGFGSFEPIPVHPLHWSVQIQKLWEPTCNCRSQSSEMCATQFCTSSLHNNNRKCKIRGEKTPGITCAHFPSKDSQPHEIHTLPLFVATRICIAICL